MRPLLPALRLAHFTYTFGTGLLAGLAYAFEQGVVPALQQLNGPAYAAVQQGLVQHLTAWPTGVVAVGLLALLLPLYPLVTLWERRQTTFWLLTLLGWLLFGLAVGVFGAVTLLPIHRTMLAWNPAALPPDWPATRAAWNALNTIRTPLLLVSFLLYLWAGFELYRVPGRRSAYNQ